jgi:hypothetical protein
MKKTIIGGIAATATALGITLAAPAQADVFTMCLSGNQGVVGGNTTCAFAENVQRAFYASGMANDFIAYSPVTGERYDVTCMGHYPAQFATGETRISTRCYAGDNAEVVIW